MAYKLNEPNTRDFIAVFLVLVLNRERLSHSCVGCARTISRKGAPTKMIKPPPKWRACSKFTCTNRTNLLPKYLLVPTIASEETRRQSSFLLRWWKSTHLFLSERNRLLLASVGSAVTLFISAFTLLQYIDVRMKNTTLDISRIITGPMKKVNSPYESRLSVTFHYNIYKKHSIKIKVF